MERDDTRWHPFQPDRLPNIIHVCTDWRGDWRKEEDDSIASIGEIVKEAAVAISSAFSSRPSIQPSSGNPLGSSPAKLIDSRSKCYKQLSDINNLKLSGVLSEEEYCAENEAVLLVLKKL